MSYTLEITPSAKRDLKNVPARYYRRVVELIDVLQEDPYLSKSKQMEDPLEHLRRVRLERWRIVYAVDEDHKIITIVKVGEKATTGTEFYDDLE